MCSINFSSTAYIYQAVEEKLIEHKHYIRKYGDDMPDVAGWRWGGKSVVDGARGTSTEGDNV